MSRFVLDLPLRLRATGAVQTPQNLRPQPKALKPETLSTLNPKKLKPSSEDMPTTTDSCRDPSFSTLLLCARHGCPWRISRKSPAGTSPPTEAAETCPGSLASVRRLRRRWHKSLRRRKLVRIGTVVLRAFSIASPPLGFRLHRRS